MAGKLLKRGAIIDTIKSEERMNAARKRAGEAKYHVDAVRDRHTGSDCLLTSPQGRAAQSPP